MPKTLTLVDEYLRAHKFEWVTAERLVEVTGRARATVLCALLDLRKMGEITRWPFGGRWHYRHTASLR